MQLPSDAVTVVTTGLRIPWGLAFLPDGTALAHHAVAPDGSLWVTTSNRDQVGREDRVTIHEDDDRILRITP